MSTAVLLFLLLSSKGVRLSWVLCYCLSEEFLFAFVLLAGYLRNFSTVTLSLVKCAYYTLGIVMRAAFSDPLPPFVLFDGRW